jgi:hypothetical protein
MRQFRKLSIVIIREKHGVVFQGYTFVFSHGAPRDSGKRICISISLGTRSRYVIAKQPLCNGSAIGIDHN